MRDSVGFPEPSYDELRGLFLLGKGIELDVRYRRIVLPWRRNWRRAGHFVEQTCALYVFAPRFELVRCELLREDVCGRFKLLLRCVYEAEFTSFASDVALGVAEVAR